MSLIDQLKEKVGYGIRGNYFAVTIALPDAIKNYAQVASADAGVTLAPNANLGADLNVMALKCNFPVARPVTEAEIKYMGESFKIAAERDTKYEDITITIKDDPNFLVRNTIEKWMDYIQELNFTKAGTAGYKGLPSDYKAVTLKVDLLNNTFNPIRTLFCYGAFPKSITGIDLDRQAEATPKDFDIVFAVDNYYIANFGEINKKTAIAN
jgi:hypothetical protein